MQHPLQTLRRVLEHELAVFGPYVPLDDPVPAIKKVVEIAAAVEEAAVEEAQAEGVAHIPSLRDAPLKRGFRVVDAKDSLLSGGPSATTPEVPAPIAEATPAEATPAEATPAEATPAEATPAEATPAEEPPPARTETPVPFDAHETPATSPEASGDTMANLDLFGKKIDPSKDPTRPFWERIHALIPPESPLVAMQTLEEVKAYVDNTVLVPIDEARQHAVLGVGNPEADLVIIGEAPGADEDRTGEPFTGRAGQLLNKILAAIDFEREAVYITNILKSRPPNNRDPVPAEVEAHIPILYKQLSLIKPRIILCVGKTAGNALLGRRSSLGALRDTLHDYYGLPLVVTYHPAALLRNPQWKRPTWEDMKLLRTRYDELVNS